MRLVLMLTTAGAARLTAAARLRGGRHLRRGQDERRADRWRRGGRCQPLRLQSGNDEPCGHENGDSLREKKPQLFHWNSLTVQACSRTGGQSLFLRAAGAALNAPQTWQHCQL